MKRFVVAFWFVVLTFCPAWSQERASLSEILPVLDTYIEKSMIAEGIPGAVVVIVKDGKIIYLKGFGVKVLGQKERVDEHTPFALASVTKNFTNTLVARLVDQGKLNWTDKVQKYLPDFLLSDPKVAQEMTIEDLLSQRSGLPDFSADTLINLEWTAAEIYPQLKLIPLQGEFRKSFDYQNVVVGIVGRILEKVTGKPLIQLYQEELFQPIGLEETRVGENQSPTLWQRALNLFKKKELQPTFHDLFEGKPRFLPLGNPNIYTFQASSGMISTGLDMGKWLIFQLNKGKFEGKSLVSEANIDRMRSPHVFNERQSNSQFPKNRVSKVDYGLGWFIHDYMGVSMLNHMGGMNGTRAFVSIVPGENLGIAIMTNLGGMRVSLFPEAIRSKFMDLYLKVKDGVDWAKLLREQGQGIRKKYDEARKEDMMRSLAPHRNLDDYVGVYNNPFYGSVEIIRQDNSLILKYRDHHQTRLTHWNGSIFQFAGSDLSSGFGGSDHGEIGFSEGRGKAQRLMINILHEGVDPVFERVS